MRRISLLLCASLLACSPANDDAVQVSPVDTEGTGTGGGGEVLQDQPVTGFDAYGLDTGGLMLFDTSTDASLPIPFGSILSDVEQAISAASGVQSAIGSNDECPAGAMEFSNHGLVTLNYQDGYFVGWSTVASDDGEAGPATLDGLSIGTSRAEIEQFHALEAVEDSSLGYEYFVGDLQIILSGTGSDARIENMWAGTNCIFR